MPSKLTKGESYLIGLIIGAGVGIPVGFLLMFSGAPFLTIILAVIAVAIWVLGSGLRQIPERHNAVPTFLGSPAKNILSDGWVWWFPSWLGGDIMAQVSVAKQQMEITVGDTTGSGEIYSKDGTPVSITVTVIYTVRNVWRWIVEYEGDPSELIRDFVERLTRWFTDEFDAEDLVKLNAVMAQVLSGNIPEDRVIRYRRTIMDDNGHGIPTTKTLEETIELPEIYQTHSLSVALEEVGAELNKVIVRRIAVPQELSAQWMRRAKERAQREAELADAQTTVALMELLQKPKSQGGAGMTRDQARNMIETMRGRGKRQIVTFEGDALGALATLLGGVVKDTSSRSSD